MTKVIRIIYKAQHCRPLFVQLDTLTNTNLYIFVDGLVAETVDLFRLRNDAYESPIRMRFPIRMTTSHLIMPIKVYNKVALTIIQLAIIRFKRTDHKRLVGKPFYSLNEFLPLIDNDIL